MSLQRNDFIPQNILTVYTSPSGMVDIRTGLPYQAGGLKPGDYFDLTEAEAQTQSPALHQGRYRFVQVDSTAVAANILQGTIGCMKSLAQGVNFITDFSLNIGGTTGLPRGVVFLAPLTAAQVAAGAYVFVQEAGDATLLAAGALATVGTALIVVTGGKVNTGTTINLYIGVSMQAAAGSGSLFRAMLDMQTVAG
jgi:hypothetical protein